MQGARARVQALVAGIFLAGPAAAQTVVASIPSPGHELRERSEALENDGDWLGAVALLQSALESDPHDAQLHWRIARGLLRHVESHPQLDAEARRAFFERARTFADAGRRLDPDCAECCVYQFASVGRLTKERGLRQALDGVREADRLVGECLANPPSYRDASGSEEAGLYFGAAVYYRMLPDAAWFRWATGLHSDATRAVELARRAVRLEERPRHRLELGAALLCDGSRRDDDGRIAEGWQWVEAVAAGVGADASRARGLLRASAGDGCALSYDDPAPTL